MQASGQELTMNKAKAIFTSVAIGDIGVAANRIALASMTRSRATTAGLVGPVHATYYAQRASAGLILTEATNISPQAIGWWCSPNFWTEEQIKAWKPVVAAVHNKKSLIVLQLWHTGRASHSIYQPNNSLPISASAIPITTGKAMAPVNNVFTPCERETPRALETSEVTKVLDEYVLAAQKALELGFDGVELHAANGYFLDQFLQSNSNKRNDKYGGSVENRVSILSELFEKLKTKVPLSKVGIRFSPNGNFNDMGSEDNIETFTEAIKLVAKNKLAYVHVIDGLGFGFHNKTEPFTLERTMKIITEIQTNERVTKVIGNCGYNKETAEKAIEDKTADLIAIGRPFIANPDLVERYKNNIPITDVEGTSHYYTPNSKQPEKGYIDFKTASI